MLTSFTDVVIDKLRWYVYALIDPRTSKPFYIGKGKANRIFDHANGNLDVPKLGDRMKTIKTILASGNTVTHLILRHALSEERALEIESVLIDYSKLLKLRITNKVLGHGSSGFGIMTAEDVQRLYGAIPLPDMADDCMLVNINRLYKKAQESGDYYEAAKEAWTISEKKRGDIQFVLAEYKGFVVEVYKVTAKSWYEVAVPNDSTRKKYGFSKEIAPANIRERYLHKQVPQRKRGDRNSVRYRI